MSGKCWCDCINAMTETSMCNGCTPEPSPSKLHPWYGPCDALAESECAECLNVVGSLRAEIERLNREVNFLRLYGNKDCTAMADERLAENG